MSDLDRFLLLLKAHGLPAPETEVSGLVPGRKFRVDYYWAHAELVVEKDGGVWTKGGHSSGSGILRDMEKANLLQLAGKVVLRFTPQQLESGDALPVLRQVLA